MKKIFYFASIAALAFSSCTKDDTTGAVIDTVGGGSKIMAKAEGDATRTHLELNEDGNYEFRWSENDVIGVYGSDATSAKNVPFALLDSYADQAEGIFESNYKLLAGDNFFAYYPQVPGNDYAPQWVKATATTAGYWNLAPFKMKISKDQNYKPGSFNTVTAPAVSTAFTIDEDGNADVTMQPVGDYLFVNLAGTEDIQNVTLELWSATRRADTVTETGVWSYVGSNERIAAEFEKMAACFINQPYNSPYNYFRDGMGPYARPTTDVKDWEYTIVETRTPNYTNYEAVNIAGEGILKEYTYVDANKNASTRYYLSNEGMTSNKITLAAGQLTDVVCHEPNVYVFVVPGGLLGTNPLATGSSNKELVAKVYVNKEGNTNYTQIEGQTYFEFGGESLNGGYALKADGVTPDTTKPIWRQKTDNNGKMIVSGIKWENTVFWANAKVKGVREAALYNPENDFIIYNEVDFLKYMNEYADEDSEECFEKNAYVCSEYEFDFSEENMGKLATQVKEEYLRAYISDYIANGMPCIEEYENDFRGNGATLKAITKLQSWYGLFGIITPEATINNVTFEDIEAAESFVLEELSTRGATGNYEQFILAMSTLLDEGFILGTVYEDNEKGNNINKVTVKNAKGGAVFGGATVAAFNGVTYDGVAGLNSIAVYLAQNADLDLTKTWDVVKGVKGNVFGMIKAVPVTDSKQNVDGHHVVTIAKGGSAEYQKLAAIIYVAGLQGDTAWQDALDDAMEEDEDFDLEDLEEFIEDWANEYYDIDDDELAWEYDNCATSVVIENVSYWTGDYIGNAAADKNGNYAIDYAEQLAAGLARAGQQDLAAKRELGKNAVTRATWTPASLILQRDINLNYENNNTLWEMTDFYDMILDGNKKTITGFVMGSFGDYYVAPFDEVYAIKDLTVNGVNITVKTNDKYNISVPTWISGLVDYVESAISNVTVNDINFDAYDISGGFNSMDDPYYDPEKQTFIGWVASCSENAQFTNVKANVTSSNIKGISGLVGYIYLYDVTESHFEGCSLTTGKIAQEALTDFVPVLEDYNDNDDYIYFNGKGYQLYNVAGSMVGFVYNSRYDDVARSIEFNNSGAPKFVYDAGIIKDNNKINVLYNDKKHTTLLGLDYTYNGQ